MAKFRTAQPPPQLQTFDNRRLNDIPVCIALGYRTIVSALKRSGNTEIYGKLWEHSQEECSMGRLSNPTPVAKLDMGALVDAPRFCTSDQNGEKELKPLIIDDFAESLVHSALLATEPYFPNDLGMFLNIGRGKLNRPGGRIECAQSSPRAPEKRSGCAPIPMPHRTFACSTRTTARFIRRNS